MALANITDVSDSLGRPIVDAAEIAQVTTWLGQVEGLIVTRLRKAGVSDLDSWVDHEDGPTMATFVGVEVDSVIRKIKNPDGKQNERIDDYSYGLNEDARRGELFLTDDEWGSILPSGQTDAFSIRFVANPGFADPWCR